MRNADLDPDKDNLTPVEREIEKVLRPIEFEDFTGQVNSRCRRVDIDGSRNLKIGSLKRSNTKFLTTPEAKFTRKIDFRWIECWLTEGSSSKMCCVPLP